MEPIGITLMPRKRKRHVFHSYGPPASFTWRPQGSHAHQLIEVQVPFGGAMLVIDKCQVAGCDYEVGRDLISPTKGDTDDQNA